MRISLLTMTHLPVPTATNKLPALLNRSIVPRRKVRFPHLQAHDTDEDLLPHSCRRQDASDLKVPLMRLSTSNISLPQLSHLGSINTDTTSKPPRNIVPPASPTVRTHFSPSLNPDYPNGDVPSGTSVSGTTVPASGLASSPPYAFSARPLPRRQNPTCLSTSPRSIELVTPLTYMDGIASTPASLNHVVRWSVDGTARDVTKGQNGTLIRHRELTPPNMSPK